MSITDAIDLNMFLDFVFATKTLGEKPLRAHAREAIKNLVRRAGTAIHGKGCWTESQMDKAFDKLVKVVGKNGDHEEE